MELWILAITVVFILVVAIVSFVISMNKSSRPNNVFIIGCTGSGKTKLFYYLTANKNFPSVTSQTVNKFTYQEGNKEVTLIDLPGHPRIRTQNMSAIKAAKAIILVVDSETVLSQLTDIANLLYDILSIKEIIKYHVPVLVLGAKSDIPNSRPIDLIREELEKEINFIRGNHQEDSYVRSDDESTFLYLGEEGKDFNFDQIDNTVSFATCSVAHDNVSQVISFIAKTCK